MKKQFLLFILFVFSNKIFCQQYSTSALKKVSNKVLLDSICSYLLKAKFCGNDYYYKQYNYETAFCYPYEYYSSQRRIFTNQLINKPTSYNLGDISIDTIIRTIRFHFMGTMGSGGFAPNIQLTFYFQYISSLEWNLSGEEDSTITMLRLISPYNGCDINSKNFIAEFEIQSGCRNSEDRERNMPDYIRSLFAEYVVIFDKASLTDEDKRKLTNLFNELMRRRIE